MQAGEHSSISDSQDFGSSIDKLIECAAASQGMWLLGIRWCFRAGLQICQGPSCRNLPSTTSFYPISATLLLKKTYSTSRISICHMQLYRLDRACLTCLWWFVWIAIWNTRLHVLLLANHSISSAAMAYNFSELSWANFPAWRTKTVLRATLSCRSAAHSILLSSTSLLCLPIVISLSF